MRLSSLHRDILLHVIAYTEKKIGGLIEHAHQPG